MDKLATPSETGGLARELGHEIRNALHAVRLNLHTLRLASAGKTDFTAKELENLYTESDREIEQADHLLKQLLNSVAPKAEPK